MAPQIFVFILPPLLILGAIIGIYKGLKYSPKTEIFNHFCEGKHDTNKNAARLCDDCNLPFCTECLRKNLLGFYYCQNCYPALFKDASAST